MVRKKAVKKKKPQRKAPTGIIGGECMDTTWQTPPHLIERVRAYYGGQIPFDAASAKDNPTDAKKFWTAEDNDGLGCLGAKWPKRTWINPPYGRIFPIMLGRIGWEAILDNEVLALLPCSRWEQRYFQMALYNMGRGVLVCMVRKRVNFIRPSTGDAVNGNTYANMFVCWNGNEERFMEAFGTIGACYRWTGLCPTPEEK